MFVTRLNAILLLFVQFLSLTKAIVSNSTTREDEAIAKTLAKIYGQDESNRLIGLFCRVRCLRERGMVGDYFIGVKRVFYKL
jgi:hypothetical protein